MNDVVCFNLGFMLFITNVSLYIILFSYMCQNIYYIKFTPKIAPNPEFLKISLPAPTAKHPFSRKNMYHINNTSMIHV